MTRHDVIILQRLNGEFCLIWAEDNETTKKVCLNRDQFRALVTRMEKDYGDHR